MLQRVFVFLVITLASSGVGLSFQQKAGGDLASYTNLAWAFAALVGTGVILLTGSIRWTRLSTAVLLFVLWSGLGFAVAIDTHVYLTAFLAVLRGALMVLLIPNVFHTTGHAYMLFKGMIAMSLVSLLAVIAQETVFAWTGVALFGATSSAYTVTIHGTKLLRATGLANDPNVLALYLLLGFALLPSYDRPLGRRIVLGLLLLIGVALSFSRGAVVGLCLWSLFAFRGSGRSGLDFVSLSLSRMLMVGIVTLLGVAMLLSGARQVMDSSFMNRLGILVEMFGIACEKPLLGTGLGNLSIWSEYGRTAHNLVLEVAASTGIPGLMLFMWVLTVAWGILRMLRTSQEAQIRRLALGAASLMTMALSVSLFLSTLTNLSLWMTLGLVNSLAALRTDAAHTRSRPVNAAGAAV